MKRIYVTFLALFVSQMNAQQESQPVRLNDCISQALGKNPSLQISEAKVEAAEARSSEVSASLLPQLKLTGRAVELSQIDPFGIQMGNTFMTIFPSIKENYSLRLTLQQPVFTGLKLLKSREIAKLNAGAAREDLTKDQADLVLNVIVSYWNLYRAIRIEEVIRQSVDQMSEHLKDITNLEKQGLATGSDVMKVQVQFSDIKVKHIEARNAIKLASMALNSILRNNLDLRIEPSDTPAVSQAGKINLGNKDLRLLQQQALEKRPELKSMKLRNEMSSAGVTAARGGWYPQIFLTANYDYARPNQRIIPPKDRWDVSWDVGLTFQWNIWDWLATSYQTAQAKAVQTQTEAGITQLTDAVMLEVAQQYFNAQAAGEKVDVAFDAVQQAQESYRMTSEKFKNGVASNTDLLDSENALLQAKWTHTQSVVDCTLAIARLKRSIGEDQ